MLMRWGAISGTVPMKLAGWNVDSYFRVSSKIYTSPHNHFSFKMLQKHAKKRVLALSYTINLKRCHGACAQAVVNEGLESVSYRMSVVHGPVEWLKEEKKVRIRERKAWRMIWINLKSGLRYGAQKTKTVSLLRWTIEKPTDTINNVDRQIK